MSGQPVNLSPQGPPETVLAPDPDEVRGALDAALALADATARRDAVAEVARHWPRSLDAWARLSEITPDDVLAYACARVGYHRGLDLLRQSGWRGAGYVRWRHPSNRGFLRALAALQASAERIGERDEAERCAEFLLQLEPDWSRLARD
jgi:hypothetical protein